MGRKKRKEQAVGRKEKEDKKEKEKEEEKEREAGRWRSSDGGFRSTEKGRAVSLSLFLHPLKNRHIFCDSQ